MHSTIILYRVIKNPCAPDDCIVIIRCTETFDYPVFPIKAS